MGGCVSAPGKDAKVNVSDNLPKSKKGEKVSSPVGGYKFTAIKDSYESLEEVAEALHNAGLESSNLVRFQSLSMCCSGDVFCPYVLTPLPRPSLCS